MGKKRRGVRLDIQNEVIKKLWDPSKSQAANFTKLGLKHDINAFDPFLSIDGDDQLEDEDVFDDAKRLLEQQLHDAGETDHLHKERQERRKLRRQQNKDQRNPIYKELFPQEEVKERKVTHLSHTELLYIRDLIAKYGTNTRAMALDHKLNYWQFTERVLQKKIELYNDQIQTTKKDLTPQAELPLKPIPTLKKAKKWRNKVRARKERAAARWKEEQQKKRQQRAAEALDR